MMGVPIREPKTPPLAVVSGGYHDYQKGTYVADGKCTSGHVFNSQFIIPSLLMISTGHQSEVWRYYLLSQFRDRLFNGY